MTCYVDVSADWRYYWFKETSECSNAFTIKNGTSEQNISISEGGIYYCRGGRGDPVFFTENSNTVPIYKRAKITQNVIWSKVFIGERISLTCEISDDGGTEWAFEWRTSSSETTAESTEKWVFNASVSSAGEYWCRGKKKLDLCSSTIWSYPIKMTVMSGKPKAKISVDLFPLNGKWTLTCSVKSSRPWKYFWYKGEKSSEFLPTHQAAESNKHIHVSQTGLYWCRGGRGDPIYYTEFSESLKVGTQEESILEESSSLITGLACGSLLIKLVLLLMCWFTNVIDLCYIKFIQSVNLNQASAAQQTISLDEIHIYSTLLHGDQAVYESLPHNRNIEIGEAADDDSALASCDQAFWSTAYKSCLFSPSRKERNGSLSAGLHDAHVWAALLLGHISSPL
ncbi:hypothetical protein CHARACLAT_009384 [Characodon lateralis]|uniref:Ig-like domain-containing protein n=1 Tax=Characodon lateralis TaxID=208331 RepID=A0ABU7ETE0_9TELE|nr:hypothetical protein [Characodon lateralis]